MQQLDLVLSVFRSVAPLGPVTGSVSWESGTTLVKESNDDDSERARLGRDIGRDVPEPAGAVFDRGAW